MRSGTSLLFTIVGVLACAPLGCTPGSGDGAGAGDGNDGGSNGDGGSGAMSSGGAPDGGSGTGGAPECTGNAECDQGSICQGGACVPGCAEDKPCGGGLTCCAGDCVNTATDVDHCGNCDTACDDQPHAMATCNGTCGFAPCETGFNDCNGTLSDGCETTGDCECTPGATQPCYDGPPGTENFPPCTPGIETCNDAGNGWGPCYGQVFPTAELCANGVDEDCNGTPDDVPDNDGDGWTACEGDCCDVVSGACANPALVNPGAFEVAGNQVDDDCDGNVDNVLGACDSGLASNSGQALDYAKAIDLCQTTSENATGASKTWGVISGSFSRADGTSSPTSNQRSIRAAFGSGIVPKSGANLAIISTGAAATPGQTSPGYTAPQVGLDNLTTSGVPADWLSANNGNFPNAPGCPDPSGGTVANDPIMLKLRIRVPTNAKSFTVSTDFYSTEYPEWVCSPFNDFFLLLLDSAFVPGPGQSPNPADKNLAFYDPLPIGGTVYPVGVNLAFGNTGLFVQCKNGPTGCGGIGSVGGTTSSCVGTTELSGTGFDVTNPPANNGLPGWCGSSNLSGGATSWLTTSGNVAAGEIIELRFVTWDTDDHLYDSTVLLDNFQWSVDASQPGTKGD